jgi:Spy/CpxP family protein refolding chaperone
MTMASVMLGAGAVLAQANPPNPDQQGRMMPGRMGGCPMMGHGGAMMGLDVDRILAMQQDLKLTEDQVNRLRALRTGYRKEAVKRQAEIRALRIDLADSLDKPTPDFAAARSHVKKISELQQLKKLEMLATYEKGLNVLTKEQKDALRLRAPGMMMHQQGMGDMDQDED